MANILKRSLNLFLCLALVLSMMSAVTLTAAAEGTTELLLNKTYAEIELTETLELTAVLNANGTYSVPSVTWRSSEEDVATVANGVVTPVAPGTTRIIAITDDGITAECLVDVANDSRLYFENRMLTTEKNKAVAFSLGGSLKDSNVSFSVVGYKGGNTNISTTGTVNAENNTFTATDNGVFKITATAMDNNETVKATCVVAVGPAGLTSQTNAVMAVNTENADQYLWKYGYMKKDDTNSFMEYNTTSTSNGMLSYTKNLGTESAEEKLGDYGRIRYDSQRKWWPGSLRSSVMVWTAPKSGTVYVDRGPSNNMYGVFMYLDQDHESGTTDTYFALDFQIFHNETELYKRTFEAEKNSTDSTKYNCKTTVVANGADDLPDQNALKSISVKKGDEIFFVISRNTNTSSYTTLNFNGFRVDYIGDEVQFTDTETSFGVAEDEISLAVGEEGKTLTGTDVVSYVSSNTDIAKVDENGNISAGSEGEAVIYAFNADGSLADYCTVTVNNWGIPAISGSTVSIEAKSEAVKDSAVIVAVKSGDVLKKAYVAALENDTFTASNVEIADGDSVTVFLWESLTTLKPLKAAIPVAVN